MQTRIGLGLLPLLVLMQGVFPTVGRSQASTTVIIGSGVQAGPYTTAPDQTLPGGKPGMLPGGGSGLPGTHPDQTLPGSGAHPDQTLPGGKPSLLPGGGGGLAGAHPDQTLPGGKPSTLPGGGTSGTPDGTPGGGSGSSPGMPGNGSAGTPGAPGGGSGSSPSKTPSTTPGLAAPGHVQVFSLGGTGAAAPPPAGKAVPSNVQVFPLP